MSVSGGGGDLDLIINGGEAFVTRLAELRAATEAYTKSLNDLNLGKSAVAARDEAGRALSEANAQREAEMAKLNKELQDARDSLNAWVEKTKADTVAALNEANQTLADAKAQQDAARVANEAAQSANNKAKADADSLVKDAQAQAADLIAKAQTQAVDILAKAKDSDRAARVALADAEASKAKYETAMDRIKGALV